MRNNFDQLPDESIGYDMSNLNESHDAVETLEQNNIPSSISPNVLEDDQIIHEVTEDYEVLNEPSANEEEDYEINGHDYLIQQRNDNINFLINMEQNSINSKQRMPFIFCQEKMFKLVNNMRDNIQVKDSQRSIMTQNQQLNSRRGKSQNNLQQNNRYQKPGVGVKNQLNNKKNSINSKQNIQNMITRQSTEASSSVISDTIQGLESRTNFVCQNQCNTHGIQIKKYLNKQNPFKFLLILAGRLRMHHFCMIGTRIPITAVAEDSFTSNKYSNKMRPYTQSSIRSKHNRAISNENTDFDPYSMNDPSTIYNDFSTQPLGTNNVLSKSLNNLNNNYSTLNRKLSRPSTTNSYQIHSSRPGTSNNHIKQNVRQQQNNWISPFERLKNPHFPYERLDRQKEFNPKEGFSYIVKCGKKSNE
ncbi:UNKNOWN [Stylonychia lemnae]|uniref:Uncharacterized protein n=1 Tax=Stylonychia lemnae TaxID=5949 RepID=A0A078AI72_STYLE|nr:UNKNOWN [Stylonychia lemnae]|eukprot:CDW81960.1 UNKNOWN [Stylonychia lemnae]